MRRKRCKVCRALITPGEPCWKCKYLADENVVIGKIKDAVKAGRHYVYPAHQLPAGRKCIDAYHGSSGGVWTIDDRRQHWAGHSGLLDPEGKEI